MTQKTKSTFRSTLLAILAVSLIPLVFLGVIAARSFVSAGEMAISLSEQAIDDQAADLLETSARQTAQEVAHFLRDRKADTLALSAAEPSRRVYTNFYRAHTGTVWQFVKGKDVVHEAPMYREIVFVNPKGERVAGIADGVWLQGANEWKEKEPKALRDLWRSKVFEIGSKRTEGQVYVSHVIARYITKAEYLKGKRYAGLVWFSTPVWDAQGNLKGVVALGLDSRHLEEHTAHLVPTADRWVSAPDASTGNYAYITDNEGYVIAHPLDYYCRGFGPDHQLIAGAMSKKQFGTHPLNLSKLGFADKRIVKINAKAQSGETGAVRYTWAGHAKFVSYAPISFYTDEYPAPGGFGWVALGADVGTFHQKASLVASSIRGRVRQMIWVSVIVLLLAGVLILFTGRYIAVRLRNAQNALAASEEKFRTLVDRAMVGIFRTKADGTVVDMNRAFLDAIGYETVDEVNEADVLSLYALKSERKRLFDTARQGVVHDFEVEFVRKDGTTFPASLGAHLHVDEETGEEYLEGVFEDITLRKRAEEALRRQNAYLEALHDTALGVIGRVEIKDMLEAIVVRAMLLLRLPAGFVYLQTSDGAALELEVAAGIPDEDIKSRLVPHEDLPGTVCATKTQLVVEDHGHWSGAASDFCKHPVGAIGAVPLARGADDDQDIAAVCGVFGVMDTRGKARVLSDEEMDVLHRFGQLASVALVNSRLYAEAEAARDAAESANRAKSAFLANMSHELRTPLNAVIGYAEILMDDAEDSGSTETIPDLQKIRGAGKHLLALINDILDLSKIEAGHMDVYLEDFDIATLVNEVEVTIIPLVEKNGNKFVKTLPESVGMMHSDVTKVRQALFNLLSNAAKFTKEGTIELRVTAKHDEEGDWVLYSVSDTGIGMSETQLLRVFKPFTQADNSTTRQYGGTGLGLAITRRFCRMLGGDVLVESTAGQGTTFTLKLPVASVNPEDEPENAPNVCKTDDE